MSKVSEAGKDVWSAIKNLAGRSSEAANGVSGQSATIFNGPNSLARNLFKSSNDTAAWYKMVIGEGEDAWRLSGARVAAAGIGASAAARIATGGGIYKDADGNTDIIGIPFI